MGPWSFRLRHRLVGSVVLDVAVAENPENSRRPENFETAGLVRKHVLEEEVDVADSHAELEDFDRLCIDWPSFIFIF